MHTRASKLAPTMPRMICRIVMRGCRSDCASLLFQRPLFLSLGVGTECRSQGVGVGRDCLFGAGESNVVADLVGEDHSQRPRVGHRFGSLTGPHSANWLVPCPLSVDE